MNISQLLTKLKTLVYSKSETDSLLGGKASSSHTHTKSQITDFPAIPSKVSQLTNDSGFITGVSWDNVSGKPSTFTPSSHTHTKSQITDFPSLATVATSGSYTDLSNKPTIPTNTNQLTNGAGFITSSGSCNYANYSGYVQGNNNSANAANALLRSGGGRGDSSPEGDTWIFLDSIGGSDTPWGFKHNQAANTIGFYARGTETSSINLSNGYFSGSCNYANSAGNSDTLDSYHEYSFLRYRGGTSTSGEGTLWAQIGIKDYNNALPDGLSGVYQWGEVVSLAGGNGRFEIYCSHNSSNGNGLYYRSGWANDKKDWKRFIDSANIGSQSVNYANSAGWANHAGQADYLGDIGSTDRNGASGTGWYSVGFSYSYDEGHGELAINNYWGIRLNCRDSNHVTINGNRIIDSGNTGNISISGYQVYVG